MTNSSLKPEYSSSWAIVAGIDKYSHMSALTGAVNDATAVATMFEDEFRFPNNQISLILNDQVTQFSIREQLELVAEKAEIDDRVVFYFAGHGNTRRIPTGGDIGYLATSESDPKQWHTLIGIDDITGYSKLIAAKHMFFIFDACFSGLALDRASTGTRQADVRRWLMDCMTHRVRQVLTAGLADQTVGDITEDGHSIFTTHLLRALSGEAGGSEGEITASQVIAFVTDAVMKDNRSKQTPASGDIGGSEPGGDFVFKYPDLHHFKVPANKEMGINSGIRLRPNDRISVIASGVISYDSWNHFTNPDGLLTTYKGLPLAHPQEGKPMILWHDEAYRTNDGNLGRVGSLIGWVGEYSQDTAFLIGENAEITIETEGFLYLAVNDARGTYDDNQGEFEVTVRVSK
jgi:hypothetical protein